MTLKVEYTLERHPNAVIFVFFGEAPLHLARLAELIHRRFQPYKSVLVMLRNPDMLNVKE